MSINHRRISISVAANLLMEVINKISPLLILHHAQKSLGLTDFGWAQYQMALFEALQPFVTYGFANFALAEAKDNEPGKMRSLFSHVLVLKILNALVVVSIFLLDKGSVLDPFTFGILVIVMVSCVFDAFWVCVAHHKLISVSLISGVLRLTSLVLILTLVKTPEHRNLFILFSVLPNALVAFATGLYAYAKLHLVRVAWTRLRFILIKSTPFAFVILFATLLDRVDIFLVEHWFGMEVAGIYSGPARIVQSLAMVVSSVALPFFAETRKIEEAEGIYKHVVLSLWCLSVMIAPVIFGLPFVEADIIHLLFPKQPGSASGLLSSLSVSVIGSLFLSVFGVQLLLAKGRPWSVLFGSVLGLLVVPIFGWFLKERFHLHGMAYSMIIGKMLMGIACVYLSRDFLIQIPWKPFLKPILAGSAMGAGLVLMDSNSFVLNVCAGAVIYILFLVVGNWEEFREVGARFKSRRRS